MKPYTAELSIWRNQTLGKEQIKTGQKYLHLREELTGGRILHNEVHNLYFFTTRCLRWSNQGGWDARDTQLTVACDVNIKIDI
jgi:hypothetical protein